MRALGTLVMVRLLLAFLAFGRVRAVVEWLSAAPIGAPDVARAQAVRRAVARAARALPGSHCLPRALTAEVLLRRQRQPVRVSIGIAPNGAPLDAHAWTESAGELVTGESEDLHTYKTLAVFGAGPVEYPGAERGAGRVVDPGADGDADGAP